MPSQFEPLLEAMKAATDDPSILTVFDDVRFVNFMEWVNEEDSAFEDDEDWDEGEDEEEDEEECPLCKTGVLSDSGGCDNPKCLINKMGG